MAGIAGWIARSGAPDPAAIAPMLGALAHRGPGEPGVCASGNRVVLGARGPQPLYDAAAGVALALDGEVCNRDELRGQLARRGYGFELGSDAEVLLRAYQHWGQEVAKHLRGAFAFAIWDARKDRVLLARDRFGEKPLYLHETDGAFLFASEAKALLQVHQPAVDLGAVAHYLAYRYVPGPRTLVKGICKLPPATYALWQFGKLRETRYWTPPDKESFAGKAPAADPVAGLIERLDEAVGLHSGNDTGAFLSGGFDSAAIVALMAKHQRRVHTFSAGIAGDRASELPAAARTAKHFGTVHHEIVLHEDELMAALPGLVAARDAPVSRPSDIALHLLAREAAGTVKAVLTGDGGDEILGGYRRYAAERFADGVGDWRNRWVRWVGLRRGPQRRRLCVLKLDAPPFPQRFDADPRASRLRQMLYFEQTGWLPDHVLERGDRMAMAASLETRGPFLDHRFADYVSSLPDDYRVKGLATKRILRQAARRLIPQLRPRKAGFRIAAGEWLRGGLRELLLDHLRGPASLTRDYYEPRVLDLVLDQHLAGRHNHEEILWTLLNLEIWHRTYRPG